MGIFEYLKRLIQELIDFNKTGVVERGNQKAVTGGAIYDYHNTTPLNPATNLYIEKSGNVVNIEANDVSASDLPLNTVIIPSGYRPKRDIKVSALVTVGSTPYPARITIKSDGTMSGAYITSLGSPWQFFASGTISFNTTYIV